MAKGLAETRSALDQQRHQMPKELGWENPSGWPEARFSAKESSQNGKAQDAQSDGSSKKTGTPQTPSVIRISLEAEGSNADTIVRRFG